MSCSMLVQEKNFHITKYDYGPGVTKSDQRNQRGQLRI
jgi:hypothetical protein